MAVTNVAGKKLFLSADPTWNSQGYSVSYPTLYTAQASNFVKYLPAYLAHSHCKEIYHWFTTNVIVEAQTMDWDNDKQCPFYQDGLALCSTLQTWDLEWCLSPSNPTQASSLAVNLGNITLPSFNTANPPVQAQPGAPLVAPQAQPPGTAHNAIEVQDDLTMTSTVDSCLSALEESCTLLLLIMKKLEAISPPILSTASGSTSTQVATAIPSVQGSALGKRD